MPQSQSIVSIEKIKSITNLEDLKVTVEFSGTELCALHEALDTYLKSNPITVSDVEDRVLSIERLINSLLIDIDAYSNIPDSHAKYWLFGVR